MGCAFLWKGKDGPVTGAKVNWDQVCRPKEEGGLGIKRLIEWNVACLVRLVWM